MRSLESLNDIFKAINNNTNNIKSNNKSIESKNIIYSNDLILHLNKIKNINSISRLKQIEKSIFHSFESADYVFQSYLDREIAFLTTKIKLNQYSSEAVDFLSNSIEKIDFNQIKSNLKQKVDQAIIAFKNWCRRFWAWFSKLLLNKLKRFFNLYKIFKFAFRCIRFYMKMRKDEKENEPKIYDLKPGEYEVYKDIAENNGYIALHNESVKLFSRDLVLNTQSTIEKMFNMLSIDNLKTESTENVSKIIENVDRMLYSDTTASVKEALHINGDSIYIDELEKRIESMKNHETWIKTEINKSQKAITDTVFEQEDFKKLHGESYENNEKLKEFFEKLSVKKQILEMTHKQKIRILECLNEISEEYYKLLKK